MHGHTTFVRTSAQSAEAYRWVWGHPPPKNLGMLQPPRSVLRPYTVAKCKSLTANSRIRDSIVIWCYFFYFIFFIIILHEVTCQGTYSSIHDANTWYVPI